jgi:hypothetical protein
MTAEQNLPKKSAAFIVSLSIELHIQDRKLITRQFLEAIMTSVHALPGLASKIFYFSLVASVFTFVSMLLLTTLHP